MGPATILGPDQMSLVRFGHPLAQLASIHLFVQNRGSQGNHTIRPPQFLPHLQVDRLNPVFVLPFHKTFKIPTLAGYVKVGKWLDLVLYPVERDQLKTGLTHEILGQRLLAMTQMGEVGCRRAVWVIVLVVVIKALPHRVEAVEEVDSVQLAQVCVRTQTPACGCLNDR